MCHPAPRLQSPVSSRRTSFVHRRLAQVWRPRSVQSNALDCRPPTRAQIHQHDPADDQRRAQN